MSLEITNSILQPHLPHVPVANESVIPILIEVLFPPAGWLVPQQCVCVIHLCCGGRLLEVGGTRIPLQLWAGHRQLPRETPLQTQPDGPRSRGKGDWAAASGHKTDCLKCQGFLQNITQFASNSYGSGRTNCGQKHHMNCRYNFFQFILNAIG